MKDKAAPTSANELSGGGALKDHLTGKAANAISASTAPLSDGSRQLGHSENLQLKIAKTLSLSPTSTPDGGLRASPQLPIDSGTPDAWPGQVPAEECLALVRAFSQIRDPEVRRGLLQMVEAAANCA